MRFARVMWTRRRLQSWTKLSAGRPWSGFRCGVLGSQAKLPRRSAFWLAPRRGTSQAPRLKLTVEFFNEQPDRTQNTNQTPAGGEPYAPIQGGENRGRPAAFWSRQFGFGFC